MTMVSTKHTNLQQHCELGLRSAAQEALEFGVEGSMERRPSLEVLPSASTDLVRYLSLCYSESIG